eukprot:EG_transcript_6158
MQAWIINLDHRPDRFENVKRQAQANGLPIQRHPACNPGNGDAVPAADVATQWDTTLNARFDHSYKPHAVLKMSFGERGCAMSHIQLWRKVVAQKLPMAMILEDDVLLAPKFSDRVQRYLAHLPADWDIFYLEYANGSPAPRVCERPILYKGVYVWHTGAYVISLKGAATCLKHLPVDAPVDNYLARLMHTGLLHAYLPHPALAEQSGADSDIEHTHTKEWSHFKELPVPSTVPLAYPPHHNSGRSYSALAPSPLSAPLVLYDSHSVQAVTSGPSSEGGALDKMAFSPATPLSAGSAPARPWPDAYFTKHTGTTVAGSHLLGPGPPPPIPAPPESAAAFGAASPGGLARVPSLGDPFGPTSSTAASFTTWADAAFFPGTQRPAVSAGAWPDATFLANHPALAGGSFLGPGLAPPAIPAQPESAAAFGPGSPSGMAGVPSHGSSHAVTHPTLPHPPLGMSRVHSWPTEFLSPSPRLSSFGSTAAPPTHSLRPNAAQFGKDRPTIGRAFPASPGAASPQYSSPPAGYSSLRTSPLQVAQSAAAHPTAFPSAARGAGRLHPHSYGKGLNFAEAGPSAILASPIAAGGPTAFPDSPLALRSPASPASPLAMPGPYSSAAPLDYPVHPLSARSFPLP